MIKVKRFPVGELETNCYLAYEERERIGVIIDPGDEANFISEEIIRSKVKPIAILATHGHFDHLLAAWELEMAFNIPFLIHPQDLPLLSLATQSASWWLKREVVEKPPSQIKTIKEGEEVVFSGEKLVVIETPGHTQGSVCYFSQKNRLIFTGDTLFAQGKGRTDLPYSSPDRLQASLEKLASLPPATTIYPGHGPKSELITALKEIGI